MAATQTFTLIPQLGAGRGRLARVGTTVLYSAGDAAAATALIGWCRLVGDRPPTEVMSELERLSSSGRDYGAFCAIVIADDGLHVFARGGVPLRSTGGGGEQLVGDGSTHLEGATSVELLIGDASIDPLLSLDEGVVAADGFALRAKAAPSVPWGSPGASAGASSAPTEAARRPVPSSDAPLPASMVSLRQEGDDLPAAAPLPIAGQHAQSPELLPTAAMPAQSGTTTGPAHAIAGGPQPVRVKGLVCARGHFNDPRTRFCATCGIAMHQTSFVLTEDVRPPLGVLVMGDGTYHTLVTSLVFGREPDEDPEVREGRAQGVTLVDPGNTISRIHAEIRAVEWDVQIVDHGSTNGTFVWSPERQQWDRLTPNNPVPLAPGAHVAFGRLTATYESNNRQKG